MLEYHEEIFGESEDSSDGEDVELFEQMRLADEKYSSNNWTKNRQETAAEIEISLESQKKLTILGKVRSSLASTVTI